jgi:hypothetical protein
VVQDFQAQYCQCCLHQMCLRQALSCSRGSTVS